MPSRSCLNFINVSNQLIPPQEPRLNRSRREKGKKKGRTSIYPCGVTQRDTAQMTASFQRSSRDGLVRWLVFRQGRLARALVIALWINVIVGAQAGAEGLDVVPLGRVIVSDNVLFHLHTTLLTSKHLLPSHPSIPLPQQCLLRVPTGLTFPSPTQLPKDQESL